MSLVEELLALPLPAAPVREVAVGVRWTAVLAGTDPPRLGLAASLAPTPGTGPLPDLAELIGRDARELVAWLRRPGPPWTSVGMAALNALLPVDPARCREENAERILLARGAGRRVVVVGHFPFTERLRAAAARCDVLELRPRPGDLPAAAAPDVLPGADVVALTGTSLLNHTADRLLALCRPDALVLMLGASTPLAPVLLDRGVDLLCGTLVTDPVAALAAARLGAGFRRIPGRRPVVMGRETREGPREPPRPLGPAGTPPGT